VAVLRAATVCIAKYGGEQPYGSASHTVPAAMAFRVQPLLRKGIARLWRSFPRLLGAKRVCGGFRLLRCCLTSSLLACAVCLSALEKSALGDLLTPWLQRIGWTSREYGIVGISAPRSAMLELGRVCGKSFLRVHWVTVPEVLRARRVNRAASDGELIRSRTEPALQRAAARHGRRASDDGSRHRGRGRGEPR
jgi:hypothetical protein